MTIRSVQKIIKIGSNSSGVTIPARDLRAAGLKNGQDVEIIVNPVGETTSSASNINPASEDASNDEVMNTAREILDKYRDDFKNLANR